MTKSSIPIFDPPPLPPHRHEVVVDGETLKSSYGEYFDKLMGEPITTHAHRVTYRPSRYLESAPNEYQHKHELKESI